MKTTNSQESEKYYIAEIIKLIEKCDNLHWLKTIYAYVNALLN